MRIRLVVAGVALTFIAYGASAQQQAPEVRTVTCQIADSILGPQSTSQRKSHLIGWYSVSAGNSSLRVGNGPLSSARVSIWLSWLGRADSSLPAAHLEVSMPGSVFEPPIGMVDTLFLTVNDTGRIVLGVPVAPTIIGSRMPRFAPVAVTLTQAPYFALARATSATIVFRGKTIRASKADLAGINAVVRAQLCGVRLPER